LSLHAAPTTALHTLSLHDALPICVLDGRGGDPHDLAAGLHQPLSLSHGCIHVLRAGRRHRLDADRVVAAHPDVPDHHDVGLSARSEEHTSELPSLTNIVCPFLPLK